VIHEGLGEYLPTSVQKSYFLLSDGARWVLNRALEKYRPGQSKPILVCSLSLLKPALRLMTFYRLVIEEVTGGEVTTSYTRWIESVQVRESENQEVYLTFSARFERIWLESKKRLPDYMKQKPANIGLRSQLQAAACEFDPPRWQRLSNSHSSSPRAIIQVISHPK
jgi:hypothetical protein